MNKFTKLTAVICALVFCAGLAYAGSLRLPPRPPVGISHSSTPIYIPPASLEFLTYNWLATDVTHVSLWSNSGASGTAYNFWSDDPTAGPSKSTIGPVFDAFRYLHAVTPYTLAAGDPVTIIVKANIRDSVERAVFMNKMPNDFTSMFGIYGYPTLYYTRNGTTQIASTATSIDVSLAHYFAVTDNGAGTFILYVDGKQISTTSVGATSAAGELSMVNSNYDAYGHPSWFTAKWLRVWCRVLTPAQVLAACSLKGTL